MKRIVAMILALCMLLTVLPAAAAKETSMSQAEAEAAVASLNANSDFYYELSDRFAEAEIEDRTEVRWWMAEGSHTDETIIQEIEGMYNAGFRGVELCQLNVGGMDQTVYGYGSEQWNHDFHLILNTALDLGMTVGVTSGTNWNTTNVPGLNPDTQQAMQCVFMTNETIAAGTSRTGAVPTTNGKKTLREVNSFIGAYAYQIVDGTSNPVRLVADSLVDLTDKIVTAEDGTLTLDWTAPEGGSYLVSYYWQQATAQQSQPAVVPSYCVNYLDTKGFEAWSEYFAANVLNDEALNAKIKAGDVQLFMDSLEYSHGDGITLWSDAFAKEFEARKGYDIRPYLLMTSGLPQTYNWVGNPDYVLGTYALEDTMESQKIMNDLFDVDTQLYMENYMTPMREWLHQYGIKLRAQISYGKYLEISEPIDSVDYPEAENLNQRNQVDIYRLWTGGSKLENKILSSETSALFGMGYSYTWQRHMQEAYMLYASGFSRINWHIWSSSWATESIWASGQYWPGFVSMPGKPGFPVFGTREIAYDDYTMFNQHLGRIQDFLRTGTSRTDVGMIYTKYTQNTPTLKVTPEDDMWVQRHTYMMYPSMELQENGYTYDYFSPEFLNADEVYYDAENGTLELAGYKALVLWQNWLDVDAAQKIAELAKQGLKVVVVDGAAVMTPFNGGDAELAEVMTELKTLDSVRTAATCDDVMEALQELGVTPYAGFASENQQILTQSREDENGNRYLYAYNYCDGSLHDGDDADHGLVANVDMVLDGTFIPYVIDAWSGEVTQLADYTWKDGKTVLNLNLDYGDVALYALEAADTEPEHVVSSDLDAYVTDDGIVVRATQSGTYTTDLAYGRSLKTSVNVPAAYDITNWDLTVESWTAGEKITREDTFVDSKGTITTEMNIDTVKTNLDVKLDKLTTWDNIPEVGKGVSGKGYYKAKFNWDASAATGAYIDFGAMNQSMRVYINGQETTFLNMNVPIVDVSAYLVDGENTIEMVYSSTYTNVLIATGAIQEADSYGGGGGFRPLWGGYNVHYRAFGPTQAVVVPYVEQNISVLENNDVTVNLSGESDVTVDVKELSYDVSVSGAEKLATATLVFNVEGLVEPTVLPADGWYIMGQTVDNGVLTAVIGNNAGLTGEGVIAALTAKTTGTVGTVKVELAEAKLSAYVGDGETFVNVIPGTTTVETKIDYSIYDVNRDGVVNQLDITRAQRHYGSDDAVCDVNGDGEVNIADLILILNNYTK